MVKPRLSGSWVHRGLVAGGGEGRGVPWGIVTGHYPLICTLSTRSVAGKEDMNQSSAYRTRSERSIACQHVDEPAPSQGKWDCLHGQR